jgi:hypothetical protein
MEQIDFTPRNVTKFVAKTIVSGIVAKRLRITIADYTRFEQDDLIVDVSSQVIGWCVSDQLQPYTDKMVDKVADYMVAKRDERRAKKDAKEQ